jgi:hypothetical protein
MIEANSTWYEIIVGVFVNAIWASIAALSTALYLSTKERSKFSGRWSAHISWTPEWAESHLVGSKCPDANSQGEIAFSYGSGSKRNQYWGLGVWHLRDGSDNLAELCVEFRTIQVQKIWSKAPPFFRYELKSCHLTSRIRHELGNFAYPKKFANYEAVFSSATADILEGTIEVHASGMDRVTVGKLRAERVA